MTFPVIEGETTFASVAASAWSHTLYATINEGDLILGWRGAGANVADGIVIGDDDLRGFTTRHDFIGTASTMQDATFYKVANGDEGGLVIGPIGNNRGRASRVFVISGADTYRRPFHGLTRNAGATNPDPPALNVHVGEDALWFANAACNGFVVAAPTGTPTGYGNQVILQGLGGGTNGIYLAHAYRQLNAAGSEDPSAYTRASAAWHSGTMSLRAQQSARHPRHRRHYHFKSTSGTGNKDFTLPLVADRRRRLCVFVGSVNAPSAVTLDPSGLNIDLSLASFDSVDAVAGNGRWYTTDRLPFIEASYTLRVVSTSTDTITVNVIEVVDSGPVVGVVNSTETGGTPNSETMPVRPRGLVLVGTYGTNALNVLTSAAGRTSTGSLGTENFMGLGENFGFDAANSTAVYCALSPTTGETATITYQSAQTAVSVDLSAICLAYGGPMSPPHIGAP